MADMLTKAVGAGRGQCAIGPVVLEAGEDAGGARAEAGEAALGEGEEGLGLVDDEGGGRWVSGRECARSRRPEPPPRSTMTGGESGVGRVEDGTEERRMSS